MCLRVRAAAIRLTLVAELLSVYRCVGNSLANTSAASLPIWICCWRQ